MTGRIYQLEARDATGVFLGLSFAECLFFGGGLTLTVVLRLLGVPIVVAALPLLIAVGLAKLQLGGRPLHQWMPLLGDWVVSSVTGRRKWRGELPLFPATNRKPDELPPMLQSVDVVEMTISGHPVAAVRDRRTACLTVLVPVKVGQFAGADAGTQDVLLAGWGNVLAAHAAMDSPVTQIGWTHQSMSSNLAGHREWLNGLGRNDSDLDGYTALVDEVAAVAAQHDTVVWMTVSGRQVAGKGKLLDRAATSLPGALDTLRVTLEDAGLSPKPSMTVPELWRLLRRRADPVGTMETGPGTSLAARMGLLGSNNGVPLAVDTSWSEVHVDGTWHRVGWIETWPRRAVLADWLSGFLIADAVTTTVLYRPIDPARSQRRVDSQLVKLSAHRARKEEKGRRVTETDRRTEGAVQELEGDLASGHGEVLYLGLVCVSAPSLETLNERWQRTEQAARAAQMGLRVLYGRQDVAWAASLPCGLTEPGALELVGL